MRNMLSPLRFYRNTHHLPGAVVDLPDYFLMLSNINRCALVAKVSLSMQGEMGATVYTYPRAWIDTYYKVVCAFSRLAKTPPRLKKNCLGYDVFSELVPSAKSSYVAAS